MLLNSYRIMRLLSNNFTKTSIITKEINNYSEKMILMKSC